MASVAAVGHPLCFSVCVGYLSSTPPTRKSSHMCAFWPLLTLQPAKLVSIISQLPHLNSKFINKKPFVVTCCFTLFIFFSPKGQQLCSYITKSGILLAWALLSPDHGHKSPAPVTRHLSSPVRIRNLWIFTRPAREFMKGE